MDCGTPTNKIVSTMSIKQREQFNAYVRDYFYEKHNNIDGTIENITKNITNKIELLKI